MTFHNLEWFLFYSSLPGRWLALQYPWMEHVWKTLAHPPLNPVHYRTLPLGIIQSSSFVWGSWLLCDILCDRYRVMSETGRSMDWCRWGVVLIFYHRWLIEYVSVLLREAWCDGCQRRAVKREYHWNTIHMILRDAMHVRDSWAWSWFLPAQELHCYESCIFVRWSRSWQWKSQIGEIFYVHALP